MSCAELLALLVNEAGIYQTSLLWKFVADVMYNEGLEDTPMYKNAIDREEYFRSIGR